MLQDTQRTSAPSSASVSISTAVWMVMCRLPMMRAPASGFLAPCCFRSAIRPGISCSARRISLRPNSACERSFTLYGSRPAAFAAANGCIFSVTVAISLLLCLAGVIRRPSVRRPSPSGPRRRCDEQSRALRPGIGRQGNDPNVLEAGPGQQSLHMLLAEPEPHVAHLLPIVLAIVRLHVDEDHAAAGLQDARHLGERALRLGHVMEHQHQRRRVEPRIVYRQRLEISAPEVDVVE